MAELVMPNMPLMSMPDDDIYGPVQRAQQFKQQQNALIQQQAAADRQNMLRNLLAQSIDPATGRTDYNRLRSMAPQNFLPEVQGIEQAGLQSEAELAGTLNTNQSSYLKRKRDELDFYVNDQPSYDRWVASVKAEHPYASFPAQFSPDVKAQLTGLADRMVMAGRVPGGQPAVAPRAPAGYRFNDQGALDFIPGGPADPAVIRRRGEAGRAPPKPVQPEAPAGGLAPKDREAREAKYPQASAAFRAANNEIDTLIKDLKNLRNHRGLGGITGSIEGRLPSVMPGSTAAQALLDKVLARGQFRELQNMRNASPTGGALGNVSNKENEALKAAFAALDQRQGATDFQSAIDDAISQLEFSKNNISQAFQDTYSYRDGASVAPTAPAGSGTRKTKSGVTYTVED